MWAHGIDGKMESSICILLQLQELNSHIRQCGNTSKSWRLHAVEFQLLLLCDVEFLQMIAYSTSCYKLVNLTQLPCAGSMNWHLDSRLHNKCSTQNPRFHLLWHICITNKITDMQNTVAQCTINTTKCDNKQLHFSDLATQQTVTVDVLAIHVCEALKHGNRISTNGVLNWIILSKQKYHTYKH